MLTNVEGDLVPGGHKVVVRAPVLRLHVLAVVYGEVLLRQLVGQLLVTIPFAGRPNFRHLVRCQAIKVLLHLGGGEQAGRHPRIAQLARINFGAG